MKGLTPIGTCGRLTAAGVCMAVVALTFFPHPLASAPTALESPSNQYSEAGSWALGVVVPEGAALSNGQKLSWSTVVNITTSLRLPNIDQTDGPIYAVLSVMTSDGSVLQIASGLLPNATGWGTFAMWIKNPMGYPQEYETVLDAKTPAVQAGATISLSIYYSGGAWNFESTEQGFTEPVHASLAANVPSSIKAGDQEVFALESYSSASTVFSDMGNLTVYSILLDGQRVVGGWYTYDGGWNPSHNPLYIVGGEEPPVFMTAGSCSGGLVCLGFRSPWTGAQGLTPNIGLLLAIVAAAGTAVVVVVVVALTRRGPQSSGV